MRILLPGGTGFLGSAVRAHLVKRGHLVTVVGRSHDADIQIDVTKLEVGGVASLLADTDPDVVLNLVGAGLSNPGFDIELLRAVNTQWPLRLAQGVLSHEDVVLLHVASSTESSSAGGRQHESAYSASKARGSEQLEEARRRNSTRVYSIRAHNVYGPTQPKARLVRWLVEQARTRSEVALTHPNRVRDFVFIDDAAAAITWAVERPSWAHGREVGTGVGTRLEDVARRIFIAAGSDPELVRTAQATSDDPFEVTVADSGNLLSPSNLSLDDGIERMLDDLKSRQR